jgi:hypothetical protein
MPLMAKGSIGGQMQRRAHSICARAQRLKYLGMKMLWVAEHVLALWVMASVT